jgi:hypothetical protein
LPSGLPPKSPFLACEVAILGDFESGLDIFCLQGRSDREGVVAAGFELVIFGFEEAAEGFLDQGAAQGGFDMQLADAKFPGKAPFEAVGLDFAVDLALLPGLAGDADVGGGAGQSIGHGGIDGGGRAL